MTSIGCGQVGHLKFTRLVLFCNRGMFKEGQGIHGMIIALHQFVFCFEKKKFYSNTQGVFFKERMYSLPPDKTSWNFVHGVFCGVWYFEMFSTVNSLYIVNTICSSILFTIWRGSLYGETIPMNLHWSVSPKLFTIWRCYIKYSLYGEFTVFITSLACLEN